MHALMTEANTPPPSPPRGRGVPPLALNSRAMLAAQAEAQAASASTPPPAPRRSGAASLPASPAPPPFTPPPRGGGAPPATPQSAPDASGAVVKKKKKGAWSGLKKLFRRNKKGDEAAGGVCASPGAGATLSDADPDSPAAVANGHRGGAANGGAFAAVAMAAAASAAAASASAASSPATSPPSTPRRAAFAAAAEEEDEEPQQAQEPEQEDAFREELGGAAQDADADADADGARSVADADATSDDDSRLGSESPPRAHQRQNGAAAAQQQQAQAQHPHLHALSRAAGLTELAAAAEAEDAAAARSGSTRWHGDAGGSSAATSLYNTPTSTPPPSPPASPRGGGGGGGSFSHPHAHPHPHAHAHALPEPPLERRLGSGERSPRRMSPLHPRPGGGGNTFAASGGASFGPIPSPPAVAPLSPLSSSAAASHPHAHQHPPQPVQKMLRPEEEESIEHLKVVMGLSRELPGSPVRRFCTDACLARVLRARGWDVSKAAKLLSGTLAWRAKANVEGITWDDIAAEAATGKTFRLGVRDRHGRPVLCLRPGKENTRGHEGQIKHIIYQMETAVRAMADGRGGGVARGAGVDLSPEQLTLFVDFTGWSLRTAPGRKASLETLVILQDHYPERLGSAIVFNAPAVFNVFWSMVRPFLNERTASKVHFLRASDPLRSRDVLASVFEDLSLLPQSLGGDSRAEYDCVEHGARMRLEDAADAEARRADEEHVRSAAALAHALAAGGAGGGGSSAPPRTQSAPAALQQPSTPE
jgi:hypothetical protein